MNVAMNSRQSRGSAPLPLQGELQRMCEQLRKGVKVKNRRYHLKRYKACFLGHEAVAWLIQNGHADNILAAEQLGTSMLRQGLFCHVSDSTRTELKNAYLYYRFLEQSEGTLATPSTSDHEIAEEVGKANETKGSRQELTPCLRLEKELHFSFTLHSLLCFATSIVFLYLLPTFTQRAVSIAGLHCLYFSYFRKRISSAANNAVLQIAKQRSLRPERENDKPPAVELRGPDSHAPFFVGPSIVKKMRRELEMQLRPKRDGSQARGNFTGGGQGRIEAGSTRLPSFFSDAYLACVMGQQDRKKSSKQRTFQYSQAKLLQCMEFHHKFGTREVCSLTGRAGFERELSDGSLYLHGYDKFGRPILWVRPYQKDWSNLRVEKQLQMHVYLIEFAFRLLPPNKTPKICIIADANFLKLQQINIGLMKGMLKILTKGYPDCLGGVSAGPVNRFLTTIFSLLKPAMPARLVSKINLLRNPAMNLLDVLEEKDVPTHLGGSAVHDFRGMTGEYDFRCMLRRHKELSRLGSPH